MITTLLNASGVNSDDEKGHSKSSIAESHSVKSLAYNDLEGPRDISLLRVQSSEFETVLLEVLMSLWIACPGCILQYLTDGMIPYQNKQPDAVTNFYASKRHFIPS